MTIRNLIIDVVREEHGLTAEEIVESVKNKDKKCMSESITRELRRLNGKKLKRVAGRYYMDYSADEKQQSVGKWL